MKVLLATDGSEWSEGAARFLARFDFSHADEITVLHVVPGVPFQRAGKLHSEALTRLGEEIAPGIVDAMAGYLKNLRASVSTAVTTGHPADAILDVAAQSDADLIVLGARGTKGIPSFLLGSVSRAVAISSTRPVLVVRPSQRTGPGPVKVLFATDGSDCAMETGRLLSLMPFPSDTSLTVLYVSLSTYMEIPDRFYPELNEQLKKIVAGMKEVESKHAEQVLERAGKSLKEGFRNVKTLMKSGDPSDQIVRAARDEGADIISVGGRGMRGVRGMLGSVARNVLGHADCSVLICKAKQA